MKTTYDELCQARLLIDRARRLLWRAHDHASHAIADMVEPLDPVLDGVLEQLDDLCGETCPHVSQVNF